MFQSVKNNYDLRGAIQMNKLQLRCGKLLNFLVVNIFPQSRTYAYSCEYKLIHHWVIAMHFQRPTM